MAIELVTGTGTNDHVGSDDFGSLQAGIFGNATYVLDREDKFRAEVITNNKIRIYSGDAIMYGRHARIKYGENEEVTISNNQSGKTRIDLIVIRYHQKLTDGTEYATIEVVEGRPSSSTPDVPTPYRGNILHNTYQTVDNERVVDMVLYQVRLSGVSIQSVTPRFSTQTLSFNNILDVMYPIGSIYMSTNATNPHDLFGGTWEAWGQGRVPVGVNTSDNDFKTVEKTGGEKTHKLTVSEMPKHNHTALKHVELIRTQGGTTYTQMQTQDTGYTGYTGGDAAHNNLQPYITCYMWKRTA